MALCSHFPTLRGWLVSSVDREGPLSPGPLFDAGRHALRGKPSGTVTFDNAFPFVFEGWRKRVSPGHSFLLISRQVTHSSTPLGQELCRPCLVQFALVIYWALGDLAFPISQTFTLLSFHIPAILVSFQVLNMPSPLPSFYALFSCQALLPPSCQPVSAQMSPRQRIPPRLLKLKWPRRHFLSHHPILPVCTALIFLAVSFLSPSCPAGMAAPQDERLYAAGSLLEHSTWNCAQKMVGVQMNISWTNY